jgi:hypothetical protein
MTWIIIGNPEYSLTCFSSIQRDIPVSPDPPIPRTSSILVGKRDERRMTGRMFIKFNL